MEHLLNKLTHRVIRASVNRQLKRIKKALMSQEITLHHDILKPIKFYPYTSIVMGPIVSKRYTTGDDIHQLHTELIAFFNDAGIKAWADNKTVFEMEDSYIKHRKICIGFYDNQMHIGFSARTLT